MNKIFLLGNLGRDPEIKKTSSGIAICRFSLAINERKKQGNEWVQHTEWVRIVTFGRTAENCGKYLTRGSRCLVEGKIQTQQWEKDGEKRYTTEVVAANVQFIGSKQSSETEDQTIADPPLQDERDLSFEDDDIPF